MLCHHRLREIRNVSLDIPGPIKARRLIWGSLISTNSGLLLLLESNEDAVPHLFPRTYLPAPPPSTCLNTARHSSCHTNHWEPSTELSPSEPRQQLNTQLRCQDAVKEERDWEREVRSVIARFCAITSRASRNQPFVVWRDVEE